ncbi:YidH family protein [Salinisphaera sp.]|uniref:YidH family protein n=1 Tax=Salinisphaera sp. TaxID=1914330 RepID=UPI003C7E3D8C
MSTDEQKSNNTLVETRTVLASRRTVMAADRSLMAWVRTALSMISLGFTIYKLLQAFQDSGGVLRRPDSPPQHRPVPDWSGHGFPGNGNY